MLSSDNPHSILSLCKCVQNRVSGAQLIVQRARSGDQHRWNDFEETQDRKAVSTTSLWNCHAWHDKLRHRYSHSHKIHVSLRELFVFYSLCDENGFSCMFLQMHRSNHTTHNFRDERDREYRGNRVDYFKVTRVCGWTLRKSSSGVHHSISKPKALLFSRQYSRQKKVTEMKWTLVNASTLTPFILQNGISLEVRQ